MPEYVAEDEFVCHNQKCLIPKTRGQGRILSALLKVGDRRKEDLRQSFKVAKVWQIQQVMIQLLVSVFHFHLTGVFDIDNSHLQLTICPRHRDSFGVRWRCNKRNCTAPISWCSHPTKAVRGERGITLSQSRQLFHSTGVLLPVASRKLYNIT